MRTVPCVTGCTESRALVNSAMDFRGPPVALCFCVCKQNRRRCKKSLLLLLLLQLSFVLRFVSTLTLKLACYFATHIKARNGVVETPPPKIFEMVKIIHIPFGVQLVYDPLINWHSNNHHLISRCCHANKHFLRFCWK